MWPEFRIGEHRIFISFCEVIKMKVISRRENEGLVIGNDISVTVLQIRNEYVRLAISCPRLTPSYWEETLFLSLEEQPSELQLSAARF
jgi:carbon storage regulator CsrA